MTELDIVEVLYCVAHNQLLWDHRLTQLFLHSIVGFQLIVPASSVLLWQLSSAHIATVDVQTSSLCCSVATTVALVLFCLTSFFILAKRQWRSQSSSFSQQLNTFNSCCSTNLDFPKIQPNKTIVEIFFSFSNNYSRETIFRDNYNRATLEVQSLFRFTTVEFSREFFLQQ